MIEASKIQEYFGDKVTNILEISEHLELTEEVVIEALSNLRDEAKLMGRYENNFSIYIYPAA